MTGLPARNFGIEKRGVIEEGSFADITIFDAEKIIDKSTFEEPHQYPEGIYYVLVNGIVVIDDGEYNGFRMGKTLRKGK